MLYYLLYPLRDHIALFNVFRYITFRVAAAIVTALLLSWLLGPPRVLGAVPGGC